MTRRIGFMPKFGTALNRPDKGIFPGADRFDEPFFGKGRRFEPGRQFPDRLTTIAVVSEGLDFQRIPKRLYNLRLRDCQIESSQNDADKVVKDRLKTYKQTDGRGLGLARLGLPGAGWSWFKTLSKALPFSYAIFCQTSFKRFPSKNWGKYTVQTSTDCLYDSSE